MSRIHTRQQHFVAWRDRKAEEKRIEAFIALARILGREPVVRVPAVTRPLDKRRKA